MFAVAVDNVPKHTRRSENKAHIGQAKTEYRPGPVGLIGDGGAKAEKANGAEDDGDEDEWEAELGLVDSLVFAGEAHADPVVQGARDDFANDGQDEGGDADEARLADGEVVRGCDEDDAVDNGKDDDPCECCACLVGWLDMIN